MVEMIYYDKTGRRSKKPPKGVPPFKPKPLLNGEGCSSENGIPYEPKLDGRVKKRAKKRT